jgi:hypothetical protein
MPVSDMPSAAISRGLADRGWLLGVPIWSGNSTMLRQSSPRTGCGGASELLRDSQLKSWSVVLLRLRHASEGRELKTRWPQYAWRFALEL